MDNFLESIGVGFVVIAFFGTLFGFISFMRYLRYKETIELAKQGLLHPRHTRRARTTNRMSHAMRGGVIVFGIGAALTCGLLTIGLDSHTDSILGPWLIPGLIPLCVGASLIYIGRSEQYDDDTNDDDNDPIPPHKIS